MSKIYNRVAELIIGDMTFKYPDFTIKFDISFDTDSEPNVSKITIYNLKNSTIEKFKRGVPVVLNAGY